MNLVQEKKQLVWKIYFPIKIMGKYSEYKGVTKKVINGKHHWISTLSLGDGTNWQRYGETERECAIAYDKKLIEMGRDTVNILKPKTNEKA